MRGFRLLPVTIIFAFLLLCVKIGEVVRGSEILLISTVVAQQPEKPSNVSTEKPPTVNEAKDAKKSDAAQAEKEATAPAEKKEEVKENKNPNVSNSAGETTDRRFTAVEVELLQNLAKRREELDRWEKNVQIKEATLEATQKRIDEKITQIEAMKREVALLLSQYNTQEDAKIRSLVKIYENMKPAEAARIFDEVEMPILLLVIDMMSEKKAAPILAAMNPKRAKQLTVELANERRLGSRRSGGNAAAVLSELAGQPPGNNSQPGPAAPSNQ
jgi:flagellar motility protein MotE (MotC chaperone)